jgi:hypothetical protein
MIAGWGLVALGASMLIRGRLYRSTLAARHCPRCRYCTQGLATLTCPECGHAARSERQQMLVPRRKRWRAAGAVLTLIGWALIRTPGVIERGWPTAVPDWALAFIAPTADPSPALSVTGRAPFWGAGRAAPPPPSAAEMLTKEALNRLTDGAFWRPFADIYLRRCAGLTPANAAGRLRFPVAWPWDIDLDVAAHKDVDASGFPIPTYTTDRLSGPGTKMRIHVQCEVAKKDYSLGSFTMSVDATRPLATFMILKNDEASTRAVRAAFRPRLCAGTHNDVWLESTPIPQEDATSKSLPTFAGLRVQLVLDGEVLGATNIRLGPNSGWRSATSGATFLSSIWWTTPDGHELAIARLEEIELDVTGSPDLAWETFRAWPNAEPIAWGGTLTIKPTVARRTK